MVPQVTIFIARQDVGYNVQSVVLLYHFRLSVHRMLLLLCLYECTYRHTFPPPGRAITLL